MKRAILVTLGVLTGCTVLSGCLRGNASSSQPAGGQAAVELTPAQREAMVLPQVTQLTFGFQFEKAGEAYFSADMRYVVFQGTPKGEQNYQMYVAPLTLGSNPHLGTAIRITPSKSRNTCGYFSPDGKDLIFASTAGKEDPEEQSSGYQRAGSRYRWAFSKGMEIYRIPDFHQFLDGATGPIDLALPKYRLTENEAYDAECTYSPDGKWIVFCSDRLGDGPRPASLPASPPKQLWVMHPDGTGLVQLTHTSGYNGGAFFSPDGKKLLYRSDRVGNDLLQVLVSDIVYNRAGEIVGLEGERAITSDANVNWGPSWTPDGKRVVYATSKVSHANYEIFGRRVDGSHEVRLTYSPGPDVLPVISPDGKYLLWASRRGEDKTTQIYVSPLVWPLE
jgi:Tol biopolymer transport system component